MSTLSKKLFISVLTLIVTVGAFAATTFAWFTLGNTATVGTFTGDVTAGEGLEVRLEGGAWTNYISASEIQDYIDDVYEFVAFNAITSEDGISFTKLVIGDTSLAMVTVSDPEYISIPLEFRSATTGIVHLSSVILNDNGTSWSNDGREFTDANGNTINAFDHEDGAGSVTEHVSNAVRVSIVDNNAADAEDYTAKVFEQTTAVNDNVVGMGTNVLGAHSFFKSRYTGNNDVINAYDDLFAAAEPAATVQLDAVSSDLAENPNPVVNLSTEATNGYHTASVIINVWIEGWDANTYNALFNQILQVSLAFKKAE